MRNDTNNIPNWKGSILTLDDLKEWIDFQKRMAKSNIMADEIEKREIDGRMKILKALEKLL